MSDILDLSAPTGWWEVAVWHHEGGRYIVATDRGLGRLDVWETRNRDKALGIAEYLDINGRHTYDNGRSIDNEGEPFTGSIVHWNCGCTQADIDGGAG